MVEQIEITRPDDWHLHLRDGAMLKAVAPVSAARFARAIIMPNLVPPVRTLEDLRAYRGRIAAALPAGARFRPLMTLYLTETTDPQTITQGAASGELTAVKLYPAGATTNSDAGVKDLSKVHTVLEAMQEAGVPLLVHGEVTDPEVDIFDREAVFIERVLTPLRKDFPALRIVMEHITTEEGASYVGEADDNLAATITPQHLIINRTDIFKGGIRPHFYCLPIAKRENHRQALRKAATSGSAKFFLGTDSAPHLSSLKECACGCAGIFNAPVAIPYVAQVFDEEGALDRLEAFVSLNGAAFYRLPVNEDKITLRKAAPDEAIFRPVDAGEDGSVVVFRADKPLMWSVAEG
ncbi:dihydroorotase [Jiella endophytica]|uniref:Dihydroorotase n=1 Tax=Jiella endophytica TaxID=2558362 RepID=A0A4Y8RH02_9HYPH|nr:dihydroorotase [Jiella endophytica]TFF21989.1 dihydroorotase [Jiella endophytica]